VLIWESNINPDNQADLVKLMPPEKTCLCYRFTGSGSDSKKLQEWFGVDNVVRFAKTAELQEFAESLFMGDK